MSVATRPQERKSNILIIKPALAEAKTGSPRLQLSYSSSQLSRMNSYRR